MSYWRPQWDTPNFSEGPIMFTLSFLTATFERCVKSFAWSLSSLLIADGTDLLNTYWADKLSVAGMAAVLSILGSFASAGIGGTGPSLANEVISPPAVDPGDDSGESVLDVLLIILVAAVIVLIVSLIV